MTEQLHIGEFFAVAERVLEVDGKRLRALSRLAGAESALAAPFASFGGVDFYPDPVERAAVLCSRLIRNHPLPDGNKRTAFLCMLVQLDRAGFGFSHPEGDENQTADTIDDLAAGEITEDAFTTWLRRQIEKRE